MNKVLTWLLGMTAVLLLPILLFLWYQGANELSRLWTGRPIYATGFPGVQQPPEGPNLINCRASPPPSAWRYCIVTIITHTSAMSASSRPGNMLFYNPATGASRLMLPDFNERPIIFTQLPGRTPAEASPGHLVSLLPAPLLTDPAREAGLPQTLAVVKLDGTGLKRLDVLRSDFLRVLHTADEGLSLLIRDGTQFRRLVLDPATLESKSRDLVPPERAVEYQRLPQPPPQPPLPPSRF